MKLPFGYALDENGNITLSEYEVGVVHLIYDYYLSGLSLAKLSSMLAEKKYSRQQEKRDGVLLHLIKCSRIRNIILLSVWRSTLQFNLKKTVAPV